MTKEEKEKAVKREITKLRRLFRNVDKNKKTLIDNLIKQACWLSVTIKNLENDLNEQGVLETFKNGKQKFQRENALSKTIIALQKNYLSIFRQLTVHLPEEEKEDELTEFLKGR